ncbi:MAG: hypothetical protein AUK44_07315 [Porphyromonadaceae bacterium CG2_30_38_12]|nr:MAG: hypothetical protein AUK44_07315 [Porphyromonadaceae bacterium CG2_30_38_12]
MVIAEIEFTIIELILLGIMILAFAYQLFYYFRYIHVVMAHQRKNIKTSKIFLSEQPPVSVVICARDEADNLNKFLPQILEQDYPDFEVIVVNDGSTDATELLVKDLKEKYPNLRSTFVPTGATNLSTKKLALTLGFKAAKNEWILLTDADCMPENNRWIANMARHFEPGVEFVLGYSPYLVQKGFLNRLITYDTLLVGLQYLGFALRGKPYMGVGRNMAYRKEVFFRMKGFASNLHLRSGDDDLMVNAAATALNTKVEVSTESITWSEPKKAWRDWLFQKERHLSVASFYSSKSKVQLVMEPASKAFFYEAFVLVLIFGNFITIIAAGCMYLIRYTIICIVLNKAAQHFRDRRYFFSLVILDLLLPLVNLYLVSFGRMGSKSKNIYWK